MTPEQRYVLDTTGYLHLKNVLSSEELQRAQEAAERLIHTPPDDLPVGIHKQGGRSAGRQDKYRRGVTFDRALEHLTMHPATWRIIKELTENKPCLCRGNLMINTHEHDALPFCSGEGGQIMALGVNSNGVNSPRGFGEPGTLYCDTFNVFWYLSDVHPEDGGLLLGVGSHKSEFECPFEEKVYEFEDDLPQGILHITPKTGDVIFIPEQIFRGSLGWRPKDRDRRFMIYRYAPQHLLAWHRDTDFVMLKEIKDRLAPETRELIETAWRIHEKEISKRDIIRLI